MKTTRCGLDLFAVGVVLSLVMAIPAWAGSNGTPVSGTSGFGTEVQTLTTNGIAGGDVDFNVTATVYYCASSCGSAATGVYTYVYSVTPVGNSAALSQVSVGNLLGLFLTGAANYGVVTGDTSSVNLGASFTVGGTGERAIPPMCGNDFCLSVGTTLTFYIQSYGSPGTDTISAQDGGTSAFGNTLGPVPEPTSIALFGSGVALLGGVFRKRRGDRS